MAGKSLILQNSSGDKAEDSSMLKWLLIGFFSLLGLCMLAYLLLPWIA